MPSKKPAAKKTEAKKAVAKPVAKTVAKAAQHKAVQHKTEQPKTAQPKAASAKIESSLIIQGAKFIKVPFFFDVEKEDSNGKRKHINLSKLPDKPTVWSRPKIGSTMDSKNLVELLSQQLEYENRTYFEGCEGQVCVKCNMNNVDQKFYVNKSLGYCVDCATLLDLGQSKEGVFSDAQMELMRRSMEKSMQKTKDLDENDIVDALDDDWEEALLAAEEDAEFNV
ncbi:MAG: hypothetical protein FWB90_01350 [Fibromonadales bacterium]|nr:hypothetical protein [Fibromonadales bacterium]